MAQDKNSFYGNDPLMAELHEKIKKVEERKEHEVNYAIPKKYQDDQKFAAELEILEQDLYSEEQARAVSAAPTPPHDEPSSNKVNSGKSFRKDTSETIENRFEKLSERPFFANLSLIRKVAYIVEKAEVLKARRNKQLKAKIENGAKLNKEVERGEKQRKQGKKNDEEMIEKIRSVYPVVRHDLQNDRVGGDKSLQGGRQDKHSPVASKAATPSTHASTVSKDHKAGDKSCHLNEKPEENRKGEGLVGLLLRFIKGVLEKLFNGSKKSLGDTCDTRKKAKQSTQRDVVSPSVANVHQKWRGKVTIQRENSRGKC